MKGAVGRGVEDSPPDAGQFATLDRAWLVLGNERATDGELGAEDANADRASAFLRVSLGRIGVVDGGGIKTARRRGQSRIDRGGRRNMERREERWGHDQREALGDLARARWRGAVERPGGVAHWDMAGWTAKRATGGGERSGDSIAVSAEGSVKGVHSGSAEVSVVTGRISDQCKVDRPLGARARRSIIGSVCRPVEVESTSRDSGEEVYARMGAEQGGVRVRRPGREDSQSKKRGGRSGGAREGPPEGLEHVGRLVFRVELDAASPLARVSVKRGAKKLITPEHAAVVGGVGRHIEGGGKKLGIKRGNGTEGSHQGIRDGPVVLEINPPPRVMGGLGAVAAQQQDELAFERLGAEGGQVRADGMGPESQPEVVEAGRREAPTKAPVAGVNEGGAVAGEDSGRRERVNVIFRANVGQDDR